MKGNSFGGLPNPSMFTQQTSGSHKVLLISLPNWTMPFTLILHPEWIRDLSLAMVNGELTFSWGRTSRLLKQIRETSRLQIQNIQESLWVHVQPQLNPWTVVSWSCLSHVITYRLFPTRSQVAVTRHRLSRPKIHWLSSDSQTCQNTASHPAASWHPLVASHVVLASLWELTHS